MAWFERIPELQVSLTVMVFQEIQVLHRCLCNYYQKWRQYFGFVPDTTPVIALYFQESDNLFFLKLIYTTVI